VAAVRRSWGTLLGALKRQPLLYVSLARGGNPQRIVASRTMQRVLHRLLAYAPRLGLLVETFRLLETMQEMERAHPAGPGAITEFDQAFEIGCQAIIECLVESSRNWGVGPGGQKQHKQDSLLIGALHQLMESLMACWLAHSSGVRLSVMESVQDPPSWTRLRRFIERYGGGLFTQKFMAYSNLRGILHQGVVSWLRALAEEPDTQNLRLLNDLDTVITYNEAAHFLTHILEAVVEAYPYYVDYNSTTTQSDRGEMLYTLLDFLRLLAKYERGAWNLQPVLLAHKVLVRHRRTNAAERWRGLVAEQTSAVADDLWQEMERLIRKYGMKLPSIAERLSERFVRPLQIDLLRALVEPALQEVRCGRPSGAFSRLEREIQPLLDETFSAAYYMPEWLEALEEEAELLSAGKSDENAPLDKLLDISQRRLTLAQARRQVLALGRED
jgi:hypothetical protein